MFDILAYYLCTMIVLFFLIYGWIAYESRQQRRKK